MNRSNRCHAPARLSLIALCLGLAAPAWAQTAETANAAGQSGTPAALVSLAMPAQPLDKALTELAARTGLLIGVDSGLLAGKQAPALAGTHMPQAALHKLLAGSGLEAVSQGGNAYTLRKRPAQQGEITLAPMTVTAAASADGNRSGITEGSGSYAQRGPAHTATRLGLTLRETPQSVSVMTRQQMDDFGLSELEDVLRLTPGISVDKSETDRTSYLSRGFAINSFQYDGIPTAAADSRYSSAEHLSDTAIYDRIEVLKGSSGLMTGMGDPGGTINLVRKKPTSEFQGRVSAGAGSWDSYRTELDVGGPLTESGTVRGRAVAAYQDKHAYLDHYQRKTQVFYGVLEFDLAPDTLLTVGADYLQSTPKGTTWGGGTPYFNSHGDFNDTPRSFNAGVKWSSWEQYSKNLFTTLEHRFASGWEAKAQLTHRISGYDAPLSSAGGGTPDPMTGSGARLNLGKFVGETRHQAIDAYAKGPFSLLGREHELVIGVAASRKDWKTTDYFPAYDDVVQDFYNWTGDVAEPDDWGPGYVSKNSIRELGAYVTGRFDLHDDLKLILGSRIAGYRSDTATETGVWVPYAGIVYDLNKTLSAYVSYASIFKPQTRQDEQGNTLDPLEGKSYEVGIKSEFFDGRLNGSMAYFDITQDNYAIATGGRTPSGSLAYTAVQGVKTKGYEFELSGELRPGWQGHMGYTHKIARRQDTKVSTWAPENQFSLYTTYQLPVRFAPLTIGGGARWQSKSWDVMTNPVRGGNVEAAQQAFWLFDAMAQYRVNRNLSASLNVRNLLDKRYFAAIGGAVYSWGEPRSVNVSLRYDF